MAFEKGVKRSDSVGSGRQQKELRFSLNWEAIEEFQAGEWENPVSFVDLTGGCGAESMGGGGGILEGY